MYNPGYKHYFYAVGLFLLASVAALWSWNTLSELFNLPQAVEEDVVKKYGVRVIGRTEDIKEHYYTISSERKIKHPTVSVILEAARSRLF